MDDSGLGDIGTLVMPRFGQIFSGELDAVTPLLVLLIWGITVFVGGFARREARRATKLVGEASHLFDALEPGDLWAHRHQITDASSRGSAEVADAWREFDKTLVTEDRRLFKTVDAAEYFHEHQFAPRLVGNRFLHAAPAALTTLGLLGTFLGLTVGLRGLDLGDTSDELRSGIQTLVDGAALGFTASLWGVAMSLVTNLWERWQERAVVREVRRLQRRIDSLFPMRSPEQSLSDIASHSGESTEVLQVLHERIGSALQESVQHLGETTSRAVSDAIHESLTPIMSDLAKQAADQSADVFKEVSGQLTASFTAIGVSLAAELSASAESMRATLDYMGDQLSQHADRHLTQLDALQEAAYAQITAVNDATARQALLLDQALPRIVAGLDQAATVVGAATQGMESVTAGLTHASTEFRTTNTTLGQLLAGAIGTMDELAGRTTTVAQSLTDQQGAVARLTERTLTAAGTLETATGALTSGFDGLRAAQGEFLEDLGDQLVTHSGAMSEWLTSYSGEVSKQTAYRMGEWNAQTDRFTSTMLTATQALSDAIDEIGVPWTASDRTSAA